MIASVTFGTLTPGDQRDLERLLTAIRKSFAAEPCGTGAVNALLGALDTYRAFGHRRPDAAVRIRLTTGLDPEDEERVRAALIATVQHGRDQTWLSDALRVFLNELLCELVDDGRAARTEADTIRQLYTAQASRNPREAA